MKARPTIVIALAASIVLMTVAIPSLADRQDAVSTKTLVLPKGTYTAIVFTAHGVPNATASIGVIKVGTTQFTVNIASGTTVSIAFGTGWELERDAEIRLKRGAGTVHSVPDVWAVTPDGPLELKER